ncbi:DUF4145 domain-containing protein [Pengzhenrongella sicca]|uniref:DUF4145 domain-containing protein n=1 Tax=Pengzhenrongella sicca TaxID=2819238 RepID=A0A8A4ZK30_9MICO|nr:DUF4145 domain-containing protein [Pengzhenrongella sicca]QTE30887.1 DUF4145 domain-containing protein [Pengzhenrongella sicca]
MPGLDGYVSDAAYTCDNCGRLSVVTWWTSYDPSDSYRDGEPQTYDRSRWSPLPAVSEDFPDVPEAIGAAASEVFLCQSVGAFRAACALARAVVEATAKDQGITGSGILAKIDALHAKGIIRAAVQESAHEIRHLGNEVAHGDFADPITAEDAAENLELMTELLNEVYQAPARTARVREARIARKSSSGDRS